MFTQDQIDDDLDRLELGQQAGGGWDFEFLHGSVGQSVDWRGAATLRALHTLHTLRLNGRLDLTSAWQPTLAGGKPAGTGGAAMRIGVGLPPRYDKPRTPHWATGPKPANC